MRFRPKLMLPGALALLLAVHCGAAQSSGANSPEEHRFRIPKASAVRLQFFKADPPEVALGERLFLETRFAQFFFAHSHGNANATLTDGDPILTSSQTIENQSFPGPFAGLSMSCRACHLVAEHNNLGRGHRTYADYARRSPIPAREDGRKFTV